MHLRQKKNVTDYRSVLEKNQHQEEQRETLSELNGSRKTLMLAYVLTISLISLEP